MTSAMPYVLMNGEKILGRFPGHDEAIAHAARLPSLMSWGQPPYDFHILLDTGEFPLNDETAFKRILNTDPLIAAVFHLGVQTGANQP